MNICRQCGKGLVKNQKSFCSRDCQYRNQQKLIEQICQGCGKAFSIRPHEAKNNRGKYCSIECYLNTGPSRPRPTARRRIIKICPVCGNEFETGGRAGRDYQVVCSDKCQRASRYKTGKHANTLKDLEASYIAGFIDGEGSIMLTNRNGKVAVRVNATNTHEPTIRWIERIIGIGNVNEYDKPGGKYAKRFTLNLNGEGAISLLVQILPYMITKQQQAELAIETQQRLRDPALNADRTWQQEYIHRMKELNKRGSS